MKCQLLPFLSLGPTTVLALDDRFFYIALSMLLTALLAVTQWDALVLDHRDTALLGPLPVPLLTIARAKLMAAILFATGFVIAVNLVPSVLRPWMLPGRLHLPMHTLLYLAAIHALITVVSGWIWSNEGVRPERRGARQARAGSSARSCCVR